MKKRKRRIEGAGLALSVVVALVAVFGLALFPTSAYAETQPTAEIEIGASTREATLDLLSDREQISSAFTVPVTFRVGNSGEYNFGVSLNCNPDALETDALKTNGTVDSNRVTACKRHMNGGTDDQTGANLVGSNPQNILPTVSLDTGRTATQLSNEWGYRFYRGNTDTGGSDPVYKPVGTDPSVMAQSDRTPTTNGAAEETVNLVFAAGITATQPSDTYVGEILVTLVAQPKELWTYTLAYDLDGGATNSAFDKVVGTTRDDSKTIQVSSTTPTRDGFNFNGWEKYAGTINGDNVTQTGNSQGTVVAGADIQFNKSNRTYVLKAKWIANSWTYTVNFDCNGGSGCPESITNTTAGNQDSVNVNFSASSLTAPMYHTRLNNWSRSDSGTVAGSATSITVNKSNPTITLTANWTQQTPIDKGNMQSTTQCSSMTAGTLYKMTDTRDNNVYLVSKLADGKCWMLQNLALVGGTKITSEKSNLPSGVEYILPASDNKTSGRWEVGSGNYEYMYNGTHQNATNDSSSTGNNSGAYYSFSVANAGNYSGGGTTSSICPKGWHLPTNTEFNNLYATGYSSNTSNFNAAFGAGVSGNWTSYCGSSACPSTDSNAYYWSSVQYGSSGGYRLYTDGSSTNPQNDFGGKRFGFSVRCVLGSSGGTT